MNSICLIIHDHQFAIFLEPHVDDTLDQYLFLLREILPQQMVLSAADFPAGSKAGGSEDFAYISQQVPTLMLALAAGNNREGYTHPLHHPQVRLDEKAMPFGTAALAHIAMRWLETNCDGTSA